MTRFMASLLVLAMAGCQATPPPERPAVPASAEAALELYYRTLPDDFFPRAPGGPTFPAPDAIIDRILVGSCLDEEKGDSLALRSMAREDADLFLMIGDNVYGDKRGPAAINNEAELDELRRSFALLAARDDFRAIRAKLPMMVAWDDHDFGANDAGREFPFRRLAERIHERFWGLDDEDVGGYPGTYYARVFGPAGRRLQIIMLDTRFFRSPLTPTDSFNTRGKERYIPSIDAEQDMLGNDQWTWLENRLQDPADLRLIVSSIQILPTDGHGFESWSRLPLEQQRLYRLIRETKANGVVFVSGDRHTAFLYRDDKALPYPVHELTASSLNLSFRDVSEERDLAQLGDGYAKENYGAITIDWVAGEVVLAIRSNTGETVKEVKSRFR